MGARRAALWVVLFAAIVAGCSPFSRGRAGKVQTGSVAPPLVLEEEAPALAAAPTLASFEATDLASGLRCTGGYNPLESGLTFTAAVVCEDGRTGEVTGPLSRDLGGTGTLVFAGGAAASVTLRRLAAADVETPPTAAKELPAPDPSTYVQ
ncbi:MAG: hypothetical protein ACRED5_07135 [Propylenella sp.]